MFRSFRDTHARGPVRTRLLCNKHKVEIAHAHRRFCGSPGAEHLESNTVTSGGSSPSQTRVHVHTHIPALSALLARAHVHAQTATATRR